VHAKLSILYDKGWIGLDLFVLTSALG